MIISGGPGKVDVALIDEGQALLVRGAGEFMAVLAANIEVFADDRVRGAGACRSATSSTSRV